jgi:hypothetical protein
MPLKLQTDEQEIPAQIFVTNTNSDAHADRYDGEDYEFPPNEAVLIPGDAAVHLFGYGMKDKTDILLRLGWLNKYDPAKKQMVEDPEGIKRLANFVFEDAVVRPRSALEAAIEEPEIA